MLPLYGSDGEVDPVSSILHLFEPRLADTTNLVVFQSVTAAGAPHVPTNYTMPNLMTPIKVVPAWRSRVKVTCCP